MRRLYALRFPRGDARTTIRRVRRRPKSSFGLLLSLVVLAFFGGAAVSAANAQQPSLRTYTSPDGVFQFSYSNRLVPCHPYQDQSNIWQPPQWCNAYVPLCSSGGRNPTGVLTCFGFRSGPAEKNTTLEGAVFNVVDLGESENEASCLVRSKLQVPVGSWKLKTINGIRYHFMISDGAASNQGGDDFVYRTVHGGRCYELNTMIVGLNGMITDPPTKDYDPAPVERAVSIPLHTFKFLK